MNFAVACATTVLWCTSCADGGTSPVLTVSAAGISLNFNSEPFGYGSADNKSAATLPAPPSRGGGTLTGSSISSGGDFTPKKNCGTIGTSGKNFTRGVRITPAGNVRSTPTGGTRSGILHTETDTSTGEAGVMMASLSLASSYAPAINLSPTSLTFSSQPVNTTSEAQIVTLTNTGNASLTFTLKSVTGANASEFTQNNTCGSSRRGFVAISCHMNLTFCA